MTLSLIHGNAQSLPLADQTIHLAVTSPPYWALRSYRDGDEHYAGQLGSEPTPHAYLAALWAVFDEVWRVLRPDGSCWVNLGDKFAGTDGQNRQAHAAQSFREGHGRDETRRLDRRLDVRAKSRMLLPHRFALGLIDPDYRVDRNDAERYGRPWYPQWILRMDVVWAKPNGLPESVQDRVRASHEYWLHFVKSERYYSATDAIREPQMMTGGGPGTTPARNSDGGANHRRLARDDADFNPLGKLPGSVWEIPSEPLLLPPDLPQHFAAFPSEFPRRIVLGWSPSGVCVRCGEGRRPVCERELAETARTPAPNRGYVVPRADGQTLSAHLTADGWVPNRKTTRTTTGTACACPTPDAPTRPATVLDPFSGTGTAPIVAASLGRHGIGVDLSADYHRIAQWRHADGGLRAKALGVDRPERQLPGQLDLFGVIA